MRSLIVVVLILALLILPGRAFSQEEESCLGGEWYGHYVTLSEGIEAQRFSSEDTVEQLADKVLNLYSIQFTLEALSRYAPECAQLIIRKTAVLAGLYADFGMLIVLQMNDLGLSEEAFTALIEEYAHWIEVGTQSLQVAIELTPIVENAQ